MTKAEAFKHLTINVRGNTIFISGLGFDFTYTPANDVVKEELRDKYRYFGGLQSNFREDSDEHRNLEGWLCELAESTLRAIGIME